MELLTGLSKLPNKIDSIKFPNAKVLTGIEPAEQTEPADLALKIIWQASEQGIDIYHAAVAALAVSTRCKWVFASHFINRNKSVEILAMWQEESFADCFEYDLEGTPCDLVAKSENALLFSKVADKFPQDQYLQDMGVEDYLGLSFKNRNKVIVGHLGVMSDIPFEKIEELENTLGVVTKALELELIEC